jgi:SOS-response transcriptional repressor LexA
MFNKTLTQYRERAGINKTDLAHKVDVSLSYIVGLESGRQKPPTRQLCEKLAQALSLNEQERNELIELAVINRLRSTDLATIANKFAKDQPVTATAIAIEKPRQVPILPWEAANKRITEDDIPAGLATVTAETEPRDGLFALRVRDASMAPEFQIDDIVIIDACSAPSHNDFVLAADSKGHAPLLRQFKDYGATTVLHPLANDAQDIVMEQEKRYSIVGRVVERLSRGKKY